MNIVLQAKQREQKSGLSNDFLPAILYGHGIASTTLQVKKSELEKVVKEAGESNLITLTIEGSEKKVLIKEVQRNGISGRILHVDFFIVNMEETIHTEIPLLFVGESKAVRELSGLLMKEIDALEVECLPNNLVDHIDVDISCLNQYHEEISTFDIVLPVGMKLISTEKRIIASVLPPKKIVETPEVAKVAEVVKAPEAKK